MSCRHQLWFALVFVTVLAAPLRAAPAADDAAEARKKARQKLGIELPLEPARTVRFTTSEGTWMSVDVSPDGKAIVFDLLGDLYTVPISGGTATRLTSGLPFDSAPRFSPDGTRIAFISDRSGSDNVWLIQADGSNPKALTKDRYEWFASPVWTPDGKYLIVSRATRSTRYKLWMYHIDGGSGVELTGGAARENLNTLGAAIGADDRYLYFAQKQGGFGYNLRFPVWQLGVYDRRTGEIFGQSNEPGSAFRPALSRDGKWLVYATRHDAETGLRLRDLSTGDDRWLLYPVQRDDQESAFPLDVFPGYAFTPDSKALVVSFDGGLWRVSVPEARVERIPFAAEVEVDLGPKLYFERRVEQGPLTARQVRDPRLSPDGKWLAFCALGRLYVMAYPDGTPRRLTQMEVGEHQPVWSPDGRWIAYVTWSDEDGGHIYRVRPDGRGAPQRLTRRPAFYALPAYAPDGRRIVVIRGPRQERVEENAPWTAGGQQLWLHWVPADGGDTTEIAPARGYSRPHFTSDPERIYQYEGAAGLVSFRWDGTDRRVHVKATGQRSPGQQPQQPSWADDIQMGPDGEHALATADNQVYWLVVPRVGGEAPTIGLANPAGAAMPAKRLTTVAGDFPDWAAGGAAVTFALGRFFFRYDPAAARTAEEEARKLKEERAERGEEREEDKDGQAEGTDEDEEDGGKDEGEDEEPAYEPARVEVRVEAQRHTPKGTVVLRGARLVTMRGDEVIERGDLVITDNRIAGVGATGTVDIPAGAQVIDVTGKTIIPGFVDVHSHMWPAWGIHRTQNWIYLANLAYGVTTTRDPQTATTDVLTYADLVETGQMLGPRVYHTGPGVFSNENLKSLKQARDVLRRYSEYYQTNTIKEYMAGNRKQRQWVIMAAQELGLMPTTEGALDWKLDLTQIADGYPGHEHSLPITPLYRDAIEFIAQSGTTVTPTFVVAYGGPFSQDYYAQRYDVHADAKMRRFTPHDEIDGFSRRRASWVHRDEYAYPRQAEHLAQIVAAGGRVGLGSHGELQGLGAHWELWSIASGGMSNHDALRCVTLFGAESIGLDKDLGSLEVGKLADLIVLDRNPLADITNTNTIRYVMKNGELFEGDTLDQVWPVRKPLPRQYWWDVDPVVRERGYVPARVR